MNFQFGSSPVVNKTTAGGFTLSTPTTAQATTAMAGGNANTPVFGGGLGGLGAGDAKTNTGLTFTPLVTTTSTTGTKPLAFNFSTPSVVASTPTLSSSTEGFSLFTTSTGGTAATATITSAATSVSAVPLAGGSLFSSAAQSASSPALKLGITPTITATTATVSTSLPLSLPTTAPSLATSTSVTASAPVTTTGSMNFIQLEEVINKWTRELEEQEKLFINQATQVNAWDRLLVNNSEKIIELNQKMENVKLQQQQLDYELDFIVGQERELEECLVPLEKQLASTPVNIDPQREHMYHMAESMDTQLKQMSDDLKEIIEHLNESAKTQDSSDPVVFIGKILNVQMNSLQWIDEHIIQIQNSLDEVSKMHDLHRRENERSFRSTYE